MKKGIILLIIVILVVAGIYFGKPYIYKKIQEEAGKGILDAAESSFNKTKFDEETKKQQEALDKMEKELKDKYSK